MRTTHDMSWQIQLSMPSCHLENAGGVVVTTPACHAGGTGSIPGTGSCDIKIWLSTLGRQSDAHMWSALIVLVPLHRGQHSVYKLGLGFDSRGRLEQEGMDMIQMATTWL